VRPLRITRDAEPSQETEALRHWAERRRELLLEDKLDALVAVLERLVATLEQRGAS